jgi:hypothetical protein
MVISWGKASSGSRRFYCSNCQKTFTWQQPLTHHFNRFSWFELWLNGANVSTLGLFSRKSDKTINRAIRGFLNHPPDPKPKPNPNCHLVIDATWFGRRNCLLIYWDTDEQYAQWWRYSTAELGFEITQDLLSLKEAGVTCVSVTSDGGKGIRKAVSIVYPNVPHQRCLTHLQRLGLALLTRNPRTLAGQELRPLIRIITVIESKKQRDKWVSQFSIWCKKWESFLKERSYLEGTRRWWYTHKSLRRVRALILNALPNMFHYLEDNTIPNTTNGLEARFSSLKQHYRQHRGLSERRRSKYLAWYASAIINKEKPTRFVL